MKFIDIRNKEYKNTSDELYNIEEIIENIHLNDGLASRFLQLPLVFAMIIVILSIVSLIQGNYDSVGIYLVITILVISIVSVIGIIYLRGMYLLYIWRRGITDENIVHNINSHAILLNGTVDNVSSKGIIYSYEWKGTVKTGVFVTSKWGNFLQGDEVCVLMVYKRFTCIL